MNTIICNYSDCLKNYDKYLEINILMRLGPVLIGKKPMHIFCFNKNFKFKEQIIKDIYDLFEKSKQIKFRVILSKNDSTKILIYNIKNMTKLISDKKNIKFLESLKFKITWDIEYYMDLLEENLIQNKIPPEFGMFFGYPLKDVIGFIGHPSLNYTKTKAWKVYGAEKISDETFNSFEEAENRILKLSKLFSVKEIISIIEKEN